MYSDVALFNIFSVVLAVPGSSQWIASASDDCNVCVYVVGDASSMDNTHFSLFSYQYPILI